ncbi:hypothetical protein [Nodosilinea sp. E11]|uniref:hypothetical protein n=1 Tax=Nodosilinea sp. E11 TaxID=3037479 RepID=UPI0029342637|nr:hypothetical protein [Nodosilinea sp. E11]WOD40162.1 hypothetical protein RRF56_05080 [Nodosilinea sp. E11]
MTFQFGIEHEVAFLKADESFADFSNTTFADWDAIIQTLPHYPNDHLSLRSGDLGIRSKRWYVEGFERFSPQGEFLDCIPKGIEIRTTLQGSIAGAVAELEANFDHLCRAAQPQGLKPILTSFNPQHSVYLPQPPLNAYEQTLLNRSPEEQTEVLAMVTYGPDLNLSGWHLSIPALIELGQKLTYYSPFIVPFSFSAPVAEGQLWAGLSRRTYERTGARPAVLVFVDPATPANQLPPPTRPSLIKPARTATEIGRIEFKAFDSCGDFALYGTLLTLLKGLILDQTLPGRAWIPDRTLHQQAALHGFAHPTIAAGAEQVLAAIAPVLEASEQAALAQLRQMYDQQDCTATRVKQAVAAGADWRLAMQRQYRPLRVSASAAPYPQLRVG